MADKEIEKVEINEEDLDKVAGGRIPDDVKAQMTEKQWANAFDISLTKIDYNRQCEELDPSVEWHGKIEDYDY